MDQGKFIIGEFARLTGLPVRTIDFYTRLGLLHPEQPAAGHGYRHYNGDDHRRVVLIKQLQARKFSLQEIRQILNSRSKEEAKSAVETMEQIAMDLERLQGMVLETRSSAISTNQPAMRAVAAEALQKSTALSAVLVTLLQDMMLF